jgi:glycosyltransferase involved in cell wall biosynthesis
MKLAVVGPVYPYRGGIAHYTTLLTYALEDFFEVKLISFRRQYPKWLYPGKSDKDPSASPLRIPADYILDPTNPISWWKTTDTITNFKPDAVLLQWWTTFWTPSYTYISYYLRQRKLPLIYLVHNVLPHERKPWDTWLARLALKKANAYIVQTEQQKRNLLSLLPYAPVEVQPHPVYDMFAAKKISKEEARRKLGLCPNTPVILFFGIVRPYKGLKLLIDALSLLKVRGIQVQLVIAGEFWEDKRCYLEQIAAAGLTDQIMIHDRYIPNEEVGTFFSAADVFAAPYTAGTQSGAVKMALGFSIPLVISETTLDDSMHARQGKDLYIVPAHSTEALADAIESAIGKPALENSNSPASLNDDNGWKGMASLIASKVAELR